MTNLDVFLEKAETVAIAGHIKPDGDCVGSCLATYNYIKAYYPQIEVDLYLEPIPNIFKFLTNAAAVSSDYEEDVSFDLHSENRPDNIMTEYERKFSGFGEKINRCEVVFA